MEFKKKVEMSGTVGTVERLMFLLDSMGVVGRRALGRLITAQVERVQNRVFFHTLDALDFFSKRPKGPTKYEIIPADDDFFFVMMNTPDGRYWACVSVQASRESAQMYIDKIQNKGENG
jgi:hypothetical protein